MSNPRKPIEHHLRAGNYRPSRHGRLLLPVEIPDPPPNLHPRTAEIWNTVTSLLRETHVTARIDQCALRLLCESIKLYLDAQGEINDRGVTLTQTTAAGHPRTILNPAVRVRSQAWTEIVKLLQQFGMTPAARTRLVPGDTSGGDSDGDWIAAIVSPSRE